MGSPQAAPGHGIDPGASVFHHPTPGEQAVRTPRAPARSVPSQPSQRATTQQPQQDNVIFLLAFTSGANDGHLRRVRFWVWPPPGPSAATAAEQQRVRVRLRDAGHADVHHPAAPPGRDGGARLLH